jgi:hypothetical protein
MKDTNDRMLAISAAQARAIAQEAYIYAFAPIWSYNTWYKQAVDKRAPEYNGGFNVFRHYAATFTPENRDIVTPNNDTPYSWATLDLRAEPIVLSVPAVPKSRYYVMQLIDLFTFNFAYVGARTTGTKAGRFLIAGPGWKGKAPRGIKKVFRCETDIVEILGRTQLDGPSDIAAVKAIQAGYRLLTLSAFLKKSAPAAAPAVAFPAPDLAREQTHDLIGYLNFLLRFAQPPDKNEAGLMKRFARIGIGPGLPWDASKVDPKLLAAIDAGIDDAKVAFKAESAKTLSSNGLFGSRTFMKNNYMKRAIGAEKGLYGNSLEEAWYGGYIGDGAQLSTIHFSKAQLPPAKFFWSLTLYTLPDRLLYANDLKRYSIGDRTKELVYGKDGSLTLYVGHDSPGKDKESNWLPAPAAHYSLVGRVYGPSKAAMTGKWKLPGLQPVTGATRKGHVVESRIGLLEFTHEFADGYPTDATIQKLYDERDFQRACQAYLWALPAVSFAAWQRGVMQQLGGQSGQIGAFLTYQSKLGILTPNATTPYYVGFADLSLGPLVMEMPSSGVRGGITDAWQSNIPDSEAPAKYLILGPGQAVPADTGEYAVRHSPTFNILLGVRLTDADPHKAAQTLAQLRVYSYAQRANPGKMDILDGDQKAWTGMPPRGMEYWKLLAEVFGREPVEARDVFFHAMLKPLGLEKGRAFKPDARQTRILSDAALVGEAMAKANTADRRFKDVKYRKDAHWDFALQLDADNPSAFWNLLDERASWFYEAVSAAPSMAPKRPGPSSAYLGAYRDSQGNWLDGATSYRLRVPPNPPVKLFWSVTVYDVDTRSLIQNKQKIADRSSRMNLKPNPDGSIDIHCGPTAPPGFESNWISTVQGRNWFAYFRFYEPTTGYFDRSWPLPDFERV